MFLYYSFYIALWILNCTDWRGNYCFDWLWQASDAICLIWITILAHSMKYIFQYSWIIWFVLKMRIVWHCLSQKYYFFLHNKISVARWINALFLYWYRIGIGREKSGLVHLSLCVSNGENTLYFPNSKPLLFLTLRIVYTTMWIKYRFDNTFILVRMKWPNQSQWTNETELNQTHSH